MEFPVNFIASHASVDHDEADDENEPALPSESPCQQRISDRCLQASSMRGLRF